MANLPHDIHRIWSADGTEQMVTDDMVALVPQLHNFARSLTRDGVRADDLVQEALVRAFDNIERFSPARI